MASASRDLDDDSIAGLDSHAAFLAAENQVLQAIRSQPLAPDKSKEVLACLLAQPFSEAEKEFGTKLIKAWSKLCKKMDIPAWPITTLRIALFCVKAHPTMQNPRDFLHWLDAFRNIAVHGNVLRPKDYCCFDKTPLLRDIMAQMDPAFPPWTQGTRQFHKAVFALEAKYWLDVDSTGISSLNDTYKMLAQLHGEHPEDTKHIAEAVETCLTRILVDSKHGQLKSLASEEDVNALVRQYVDSLANCGVKVQFPMTRLRAAFYLSRLLKKRPDSRHAPKLCLVLQRIIHLSQSEKATPAQGAPRCQFLWDMLDLANKPHSKTPAVPAPAAIQQQPLRTQGAKTPLSMSSDVKVASEKRHTGHTRGLQTSLPTIVLTPTDVDAPSKFLEELARLWPDMVAAWSALDEEVQAFNAANKRHMPSPQLISGPSFFVPQTTS